MSANAYLLPADMDRRLERLQRILLVSGAVLAVLSVVGAFFAILAFLESYLMGYLLWFGIALGSLALVMLQFLTGGQWGVVTRGLLESAAKTLPLMAVLFLPVLFGAGVLYPWARPGAIADEVIAHKSPYLNLPFFAIRAVIYFAIWLGCLYFLPKSTDGPPGRRAGVVSAAGTILYVFTLTFAAVDWVQSLNPHWYSTIWGFVFVAGQGLSSLAFLICVFVKLEDKAPLVGVTTVKHLHDLGKLLFAFVMLWAYLEFSQLLIIWSGNLPEETPFYIVRLRTDWAWVTAALFLLQFLLPFLLLLSRNRKRHGGTLFGIAALVLVMRQVDLFWKVVASTSLPAFHWLHVAVPLAFGCLWISVFLRYLRRQSLLPAVDPRLQEVIAHAERR